MQFRLETITDIPPGGGIEVTVPEGKRSAKVFRS